MIRSWTFLSQQCDHLPYICTFSLHTKICVMDVKELECKRDVTNSEVCEGVQGGGVAASRGPHI